MDKLPRVPDAHGDVVDEKIFSDLYIRTSWVDASVALDQIEKVSFIIYFFSTENFPYVHRSHFDISFMIKQKKKKTSIEANDETKILNFKPLISAL